MKIVYIYTALVTVGGADRVITQKANYLADVMGHEVYILTDTQMGRPPVFPLSPRVTMVNLDIDFAQEYGHSFPVRAWMYLKLMRRYEREAIRAIDRIAPDVVICVLEREMAFVNKLHRPGRVVMGEIHIAKTFMRNFHLLRARGGLFRLLADYSVWQQERRVRRLDALVCLTRHDAESWKDVIRARVIPNPYTFYPDTLPAGKDGHTIISVGRLDSQKGYDLLVEAWPKVKARHPDWQVRVYGQGEDREKLERRARELGVDDVVLFCAPVVNIAEEYLKSEFYVMSSRFEGLPMALLEAMACGLPCVSFDCPHGPADVIAHGEDGLLVENGNTERLAQAVNDLIENPQRRRQMGQKARENIRRYSPESIMRQWENLFAELLRAKS